MGREKIEAGGEGTGENDAQRGWIGEETYVLKPQEPIDELQE